MAGGGHFTPTFLAIPLAVFDPRDLANWKTLMSAKGPSFFMEDCNVSQDSNQPGSSFPAQNPHL
jgi:hypothetical protein